MPYYVHSCKIVQGWSFPLLCRLLEIVQVSGFPLLHSGVGPNSGDFRHLDRIPYSLGAGWCFAWTFAPKPPDPEGEARHSWWLLGLGWACLLTPSLQCTLLSARVKDNSKYCFDAVVAMILQSCRVGVECDFL